ncbi:MAG: YbaK/EbsC family protein [Austwickia sp.]|nr:MAG: YbaK/EbsC family protein [Austwickia sp.]
MIDPDAVRRVEAALRALGHGGEVRHLATHVPTSAAAAQVLGCPIEAIANSLVFVADGAPVLVLASGGRKVDTKRLKAALGARKVSMAAPDVVLAATGQHVGGVAPVGHPTPLRTLVDAALGDHDVLWAGGGDELTMLSTNLPELLVMTGGELFPTG